MPPRMARAKRNRSGVTMHGLKNYNLVVEPWPGNPGPYGRRGRRGYRWRVSWKLKGEFYAEGFEDSHAAARAAAEAYLADQGIEIMSLSRPLTDGTAALSARAAAIPPKQASQRG